MMLFRTLRNLLIPALLAVALLAGALTVFIMLNRPINNRLNPFESFALRISLLLRNQELQTTIGADPKPFCFTVNKDDDASTVGANLVKEGFIADAGLFRNYVRYYGLDTKLQAATYLLRRTLTISEIAQILSNPEKTTVTVRIIEGWRLEEVIQAIDANLDLAFRGADVLLLVGPGGEALSAAVKDFVARAGLPLGRSLEGFIFPATYALPACSTAEDFVARILQTFDQQVTGQMRADAKDKGLTLYQVITLASIVEREAVVPEERPIIASVYLNRFNNSRKAKPDSAIPTTLDADPTVQYALGNTRNPATWWPPITFQDYRSVVAPYNTYLNAGLPPGPIANPGLSSIQAVINPQATSYVYFRASCDGDGRHRFAVTFQEQLANGCP